jgi:hypothetical protein
VLQAVICGVLDDVLVFDGEDGLLLLPPHATANPMAQTAITHRTFRIIPASARSIRRRVDRSVKRSRRFGEVFVQPVSNPADALDVFAVSSFALELPSQRGHVRVDRTVRDVDVGSPHGVEEFIA